METDWEKIKLQSFTHTHTHNTKRILFGGYTLKTKDCCSFLDPVVVVTLNYTHTQQRILGVHAYVRTYTQSKACGSLLLFGFCSVSILHDITDCR